MINKTKITNNVKLLFFAGCRSLFVGAVSAFFVFFMSWSVNAKHAAAGPGDGKVTGENEKSRQENGSKEKAETQARKLFFKGMRLFKEGRYPDAISSFERSFQLVKKPVVLFNLAMTYRAVSDYLKSIEAFKKYREILGERIKPKRSKLIARLLREMNSALGRIVLDVSPVGAELLLNGRKVGVIADKSVVKFNPGKLTVEIKKKDYVSFNKKLQVVSGESVTVRVELRRMKSKKGRLVVSSSTPNVMVLINGEKSLRLPIDIELVAGKHSLKITAPGFRAEVIEVNVPAGKVVEKRDLRLEKLSPSMDPQGEDIFTAGTQDKRTEDRKKEKEKKRPFYKKAWVWAIIGAAVIGAGVGGGYLIRYSLGEEKESNDVVYNLR